MTISDFEKDTRSVFHDIHLQHLDEDDSLARFRSLVSTEALGVPEDYFRDKTCVELGCGTTVNGSINMLNMGAAVVHAMDLDDSFLPHAEKTLRANSAYDNRWHLDVGNVLDLPYDSGAFDFAFCLGVLHHTEDDVQGLKEIARIIKPGGSGFVSVGDRGGVLGEIFKVTLRNEYLQNDDFRDLVDNHLSPEWIEQQVAWLIENMPEDDRGVADKVKVLLNTLASLVDNDFVLSFLDRVQAPKYTRRTRAEFEAMLQDAGFASFRRISIRPTYHNLRRALQPLHGRNDLLLSRVLFGEGTNNYFVTRP